MKGAVVLVSYRSLPEQVATAQREIAELIAEVQAREPECGGITMLQDISDPTRFTLIEHWPSQEIFLGPHLQQPYIQSFIQRAPAFLAGPPDITFWRPVRDG
ncbi:MAG: putative quinol monooxygenase [Lysobacter sp.]